MPGYSTAVLWPLIRVMMVSFLIGLMPHASRAQEGDSSGNVNFVLGARLMEESAWAPVEDQGEIGINIDFR